MNPFDIRVPCIKIANSELLFEKCRMALNLDKYDIEVQNDYAMKRNQILYDFINKRSLFCMDYIWTKIFF